MTTLSEEKKSAKNDEFFLPVTNILPTIVFTDNQFLPTNIGIDIFLEIYEVFKNTFFL